MLLKKDDIPQKAGGTKSNANRPENEAAKHHSLRLALIYFAMGCIWVLLTDRFEGWMFSESAKMMTFSIIKGVLYVLITSALLYALVYPTFKKVISANKQIEKINLDLNRKQALLQSLVDSIPDLIFYKNIDSVYLGCNKAFEAFSGKLRDEIIGQTDFNLFDGQEAELFRKMDIEMMNTKSPRRCDEVVFFPDEKKVFYETLKSPYYDTYGNLLGIIGISRDISERKQREARIQYLSCHDPLTGVYNRAYLQEKQKLLDNAANLPLSIIIGDVNGMKLINDAFGPAEGDRLLIVIADILTKCSGQNEIVARIGGDEFAVLLPNTDAQTANAITEKIRAACDSERLEKNVIRTNIALGYATKSKPAESFDDTTVLAGDFMYRRKLLESQSLRSSILSSIKTAMFEKSIETEAHAERLAELSKKLGRAIGLPEKKLDELELVATLHDIGKISIDQDILAKTEPLSDEDWNEIKKHPEVGYRIVNSCPELRHIADYVLCHHERWDGLGYPQGLSGGDIPLLSRIVSIIDAFDAMSQDRAYRKAMPLEESAKEIMKNAGTQFDPVIARAFVDVILADSETAEKREAAV